MGVSREGTQTTARTGLAQGKTKPKGETLPSHFVYALCVGYVGVVRLRKEWVGSNGWGKGGGGVGGAKERDD